MKKKKTLTRKDLPKSIRKTIAGKVKFSEITKVGKLYRLEGTNPSQEFIEYVNPQGKPIGSILRLKKEKFWSVWRDNQVLTEPMGIGRSKVIGSNTRRGALRILHKHIGLTKRRR